MSEKVNKIIGSCKGAEIDVKRFYIPGVKVQSHCPTCGKKHIRDFDSDYLSHPVVGAPECVHFYCEEDKPGGGYCGTEWDVKVVLEIKVKLHES